MPAIGEVVGDKYRIVRPLGRGGMGTVVAATHLQLGSTVALKFLHSRMAGHAAIAERFLREARASAVLKSEHVCRVFDVGTHDGMPYLVMELLEGTDLSRRLKERGPLPIDEACHYLIQACAGLAEAHAAQIIHRDLKPANLFVTARADGSALVKVVDFGIAKASAEQSNELTQSDSILGSPSYMSLEQLRSSKLVDTRSDIWSLGVTLFELVSGTRPYVGDGPADLALKIALQPTPHLPAELAEIDPVVTRCLQKDPAERFQTVAELAGALAPFASGRGSVPSIIRARTSPAAITQAVTTPHGIPTLVPTTLDSSIGVVHTPITESRKNRWPLYAVGAIAVGTLLGILVSRREPEPAPAAQPDGTANVQAAPVAPPPVAPPPAVPAPDAAAVADIVDAGVEPVVEATGVEPTAVEPSVPTGEPIAEDQRPAAKPVPKAKTKPKSKPKTRPAETKPETDFRRSRI